MRPIKLTMTAFGPYKQTESIDFNELDGNNLFVIAGNTGSGKTTIFDAICFALYGSASGSDREDNRMLRSDFASDDTHTAIELEFEIHGRYYRVLRQLGHVKKGNKSKTGERYELYEKTSGQEVPCVDRQIVSEIDRKLEAIIGLTQDQFKQIVMLPQGEFRKLLTSETENKEAILRRLFKTESYSQINQLLKDRKSRADETFKQLKQSRDHHVNSIHTALPEREDAELFQVLSSAYYNTNQVIGGLANEIAYYTDKIAADEQAYQTAYQKHDKKQTELNEAKALNNQFDDLNRKRTELNDLEKQVPAFKQKENQLANADRASHLEIYETQVTEWKNDEKTKNAALQQAETTDKNAREKLEQASNAYQQEETKSHERDEAARQLERLKGFLPTVKELDKKKHDLIKLGEKGKQSANDLEKVTSERQKQAETVERDEKQINELDRGVSLLPDKQQALLDAREQYKAAKEFAELETKRATIEQAMKQKEKDFMNARQAYNAKEEIWLNNQAVVLASHLHDGESCPVCGSTEHPNKASHHGEMVTRETLNSLKKSMEENEKNFRATEAEYKTTTDQLAQKKQELAQYDIPADKAADVRDQLFKKGTELKQEVDSLKKQQAALQEQKTNLEKARETLKNLESQKEELDKTHQRLQSDYQSAHAVYKEQLRNIPEDVQTLPALEKQIADTEARKTKLEKAWENAQQMLQQAKETAARTQADFSNAKKQLNETSEKRLKAEKTFHEALEKAEFESEDAYRRAKMASSEREELKEAIRQFNDNLTAKKQQVHELAETLKDREPADLTALEEERQALKTAYEGVYQTLNQSKDYRMKAITIKENIESAHEQAAEREKELSVIADLHDVLRGQNEQKISFERYLQIEYLEQIIDAANIRLKRLSNGQFSLRRSDRQEAHGKQSGLALDVDDAYTGQRRDVKTLSGGEKFNASLCLALGMSDVIQSFQGNVVIDTMFIDEGFGTLDEESLNKAIDTLIDLQQSGRMIGVISHVQELKTIFPARLEVQKTKEGHSRTEFVVT